MIELDTNNDSGAIIKVIGVGGAGGNAINTMILKGLNGVDFINANTDKQALVRNLAPIKIQLGKQVAKGLGVGAKYELGLKAAEESKDEIREALKGSHMVFITCGMGGGTGTGASPFIAQLAQEMDALVVAIVTRPFTYECNVRARIAEQGITNIKPYVDALITIQNDKILDIIKPDTPFNVAYQMLDEVLYNATSGIADIISRHGYVNIDLEDVKTIMKGMGVALMGTGIAKGANRALEATNNALNNPFLEGITIKGAKGILVNITGGSDLAMAEVAEIIKIIKENAGDEVHLIKGVVMGEEPIEEIKVTVVATGFDRQNESKISKAIPYSQNIKDISELPFNNSPHRINSEKQSAYKPPVTIREYGNVAASAINIRYGVDTVVNSPKGTDELKKYDEPAWKRKIEQLNNNRKINNQEESNPNNANISNSTGIKTPFIQRMMD